MPRLVGPERASKASAANGGPTERTMAADKAHTVDNFRNRSFQSKPWRACAQRAECRPTLQIVAYPDAAQRERLHAVAAPRKSPSTSSYVSIDNTLPTDVVSPVIPHPSGILARWMARPAGLFFPPTRLEEVWRWVLARALAVCGAALARLRALPPMMIMMNDVGCASVRTHPGGAIRSTREAGICELSKLAEGS